MSTPAVLDLYCCAGAAGFGYAQAGFEVHGVDIDPQPRNRSWFHQGDALLVMARLLAGEAIEFAHPDGRTRSMRLVDFAAIHASPPCQAHTALTKGNRARGWIDTHVDLIPATRALLDLTGLPYVLENVQGSTLRRDMTLCGEMFGLAVIRHRYFELGRWTATAPAHKPHRGRVAGYRHGEWFEGPYFAVYGDGGGKGTVAQWQAAMGIDWTDNRKELAEAVPPSYTEHIGAQLFELVTGQEQAA